MTSLRQYTRTTTFAYGMFQSRLYFTILTKPFIRSQTSWIWLETKLVELGMLGGPHNYQVSGRVVLYEHVLTTTPKDIFWCVSNFEASPVSPTSLNIVTP